MNWSQLRTVLWLRWRLTRNQWSRRGGGLSAVLTMLAVVTGFVFMITAWTYCLRGWLVSLMVNKRRRRSILMGVTLAAILLGQLPNLYFNLVLQHDRRQADKSQAAQPDKGSPARKDSGSSRSLPSGLLNAHRYVPPLWVANGAMRLAEGN